MDQIHINPRVARKRLGLFDKPLCRQGEGNLPIFPELTRRNRKIDQVYPFKFCPSCGGRQIERFQEYGMRCAGCGYLYFHNAASAVSAIIEARQGIILITRKEAPGADI